MEAAEDDGASGERGDGFRSVQEGKSEGAGLYPANGTLGVFPKNPLIFII